MRFPGNLIIRRGRPRAFLARGMRKYHSDTYYLLLMHAVKAVVRVSAVVEAPVAALVSQPQQHKTDISDPVPPPLRDHIVPRPVRTGHSQGRYTAFLPYPIPRKVSTRWQARPFVGTCQGRACALPDGVDEDPLGVP